MLSDKIVEPYPHHKNVIMREKKKTNGDYVELSYALMANKNKLIPNRRKTSFKKLQLFLVHIYDATRQAEFTYTVFY